MIVIYLTQQYLNKSSIDNLKLKLKECYTDLSDIEVLLNNPTYEWYNKHGLSTHSEFMLWVQSTFSAVTNYWSEDRDTSESYDKLYDRLLNSESSVAIFLGTPIESELERYIRDQNIEYYIIK